ncbi:MAG: hypothetical protein GY906_22525 [bacterium]|nr:hypothetical protein [bacterium]
MTSFTPNLKESKVTCECGFIMDAVVGQPELLRCTNSQCPHSNGEYRLVLQEEETGPFEPTPAPPPPPAPAPKPAAPKPPPRQRRRTTS